MIRVPLFEKLLGRVKLVVCVSVNTATSPSFTVSLDLIVAGSSVITSALADRVRVHSIKAAQSVRRVVQKRVVNFFLIVVIGFVYLRLMLK